MSLGVAVHCTELGAEPFLPLHEVEPELANEVHGLAPQEHVDLFLGVLDDLGLLLVVLEKVVEEEERE